MENRISKIEVGSDHQELVALFYRMELRNFIATLLYQHYQENGIKLE